MGLELDDVDRGILRTLQEDARNATAREMSEAFDVSASTVHNRIDRLEEVGVIRGYRPDVDYERAGFDLRLRLVCRAPPDRRTELARRALTVGGVVRIRELMTGRGNVEIEAVVDDTGTVDDVVASLLDVGLDLIETDVVVGRHARPFDGFDVDGADG